VEGKRRASGTRKELDRAGILPGSIAMALFSTGIDRRMTTQGARDFDIYCLPGYHAAFKNRYLGYFNEFYQ